MEETQKKEQAAIARGKAARKAYADYYPDGRKDSFISSINKQQPLHLDAIMGQVVHKFFLSKEQAASFRSHMLSKPFWSDTGVYAFSEPEQAYATVGLFRGHNRASTTIGRILAGTEYVGIDPCEETLTEAYVRFDDLMDGLFAKGGKVGEAERLFLWKWMHKVITKPTHQTQQVIVMHDKGGTGKSTIGEIVRRLMGSKVTHFEDTVKGCQGDFFSGSIEGKGLLHIDECMTGSTTVFESFKAWSTGSELVVNKKGVQPYNVPNNINIYMCSNKAEGAPIPFQQENRRFYWFRTSKGPKAGEHGLWLSKQWEFMTKAQKKGFLLGCWQCIEDHVQGSSEGLPFVAGGMTSGFTWQSNQISDDQESAADSVRDLFKMHDAAKPLVVLSLLNIREGEYLSKTLQVMKDSQLNALMAKVGVTLVEVDYKGDDPEVTNPLMQRFGKTRRIRAWCNPAAIEAMKTCGATSKAGKLAAVLKVEPSPF